MDQGGCSVCVETPVTERSQENVFPSLAPIVSHPLHLSTYIAHEMQVFFINRLSLTDSLHDNHQYLRAYPATITNTHYQLPDKR